MLMTIKLGQIPDSHPILTLIGEGISKILGKNFLPAILLFPSPMRRGIGRGFSVKRETFQVV
jgi:hypothetical protein